MVDFDKILNENINHSTFLDREGVIKAMVECYNLGIEHSTINYNKLNNSSESFQDKSKIDSELIEGSV